MGDTYAFFPTPPVSTDGSEHQNKVRIMEEKEIESALKEVTSDKMLILVEKKRMEETLGEIATKGDFTLTNVPNASFRLGRPSYLKRRSSMGIATETCCCPTNERYRR